MGCTNHAQLNVYTLNFKSFSNCITKLKEISKKKCTKEFTQTKVCK